MRGLLVAVEGIDGSGKTTTCREVANRLSKANFPARYWHPYNIDNDGGIIKELSRTGDSMRDSLHKDDPTQIVGYGSNQFLQNAIFYTSARRLLEPLNQGVTICADRYWLSRIIFMELFCGMGDSFGPMLLHNFLSTVINDNLPAPDMTFHLQIEPTLAYSRMSKSRGTIETQERFDLLKHQDKILGELIGDDNIEFLRGVTKTVDAKRDNEQIVEDIAANIVSHIQSRA